MRFANAIQIRVFSKDDEDEARIISGLKELVAFDYEKEKIKFSSQTAIGFNEAKIRIFTISLDKERHVRAFLGMLMQKLNDMQKELLLRQRESRLDDELDFYIRLDKDKLLNEHLCWITDSGNCYHIRISIAAFPRKREVALKIIEQIIKM